ncbi:hypothetical protein GE061_015090 [Apolygus lucorum]|uniref:MICOS complex subunit MIC60 n=1 Tax=Apolygus lucorum TaxID=248454 RepID=A0A6A4JPM0_APOLU|nr:hypothetical protein GE061_015090 [Apolygus lucorum]
MLEHTLFALVRSTLRAGLRPRYAITGPMVRLIQTSSSNHKSNGCEAALEDGCGEPPKEPPMSKSYYALGALIIGTGALVAYAKFDEEFRSFLTENAPYVDEFVSFITAEEMSQTEYILKIVGNYKNMIIDDISNLISKQLGHELDIRKRTGNVCEDTGKPFRAPTSAFVELANVKHDSYEEARTSLKNDKGVEEIKQVKDSDYKDKKKKELSANSNVLSPDTLVSLEKEINKSAEAAIRAYIMAGCFLREFTEDVCRLLSVSIEKADQKLWAELRKKGEERNNYIEKAEAAARQAEEKLHDLQHKLDEPDLPGGENARSHTKRNIQKVLKQLEQSKKDYENERNNATVIDRMWTKVLEARSHFLDDIETLNPTFRLTDKEIKLPDAEMNIFIHNALLVALHLQTEFLKLDTVGKLKLRSAVEQSRKGVPDAVDSAIELEIEKEKRKISMEYYKKYGDVHLCSFFHVAQPFEPQFPFLKSPL